MTGTVWTDSACCLANEFIESGEIVSCLMESSFVREAKPPSGDAVILWNAPAMLVDDAQLIARIG
jgi:hypothetical protein